MHLLHGTFRADRHADLVTPEPPVGAPPKPTGLNGAAKAEWDRMVGRLTQNGTLAIVDDAALYQYARLFAETEGIDVDCAENRKLAKRLMRTMKKLDGPELVEAVTEIVKLRYLVNKNTRDLRQGRMAIRQYLVEFGMTPAARTRVKLPSGSKPKSKVEQFLARRGTGA